MKKQKVWESRAWGGINHMNGAVFTFFDSNSKYEAFELLPEPRDPEMMWDIKRITLFRPKAVL